MVLALSFVGALATFFDTDFSFVDVLMELTKLTHLTINRFLILLLTSPLTYC